MAKKPAPIIPVCQPAPVPYSPPATSAALTHPLPGVIQRQSLNLYCGASGVGKSALLATLMRDFRDGRPIFGHQPNAVTGLGIVLTDRPWDQGAQQWFTRAGFPEIPYYSLVDDRSFSLNKLRKKHERPQFALEFIDKLKLPRGAVIALDPGGQFFGGNLLDFDTCATAAQELTRGLVDRDQTLIVLLHTPKAKNDPRAGYIRPQDRVLGSAALGAYSATQLVLISPEELDKPYYQFSWHTHLTKSEMFSLDRDEQGLFVPYSGADEGNCARVLLLFPDDAADVKFGALKELAAAIPLSEGTLKRVLGVLVERARIEKSAYGLYRRILLH